MEQQRLGVKKPPVPPQRTFILPKPKPNPLPLQVSVVAIFEIDPVRISLNCLPSSFSSNNVDQELDGRVDPLPVTPPAKPQPSPPQRPLRPQHASPPPPAPPVPPVVKVVQMVPPEEEEEEEEESSQSLSRSSSLHNRFSAILKGKKKEMRKITTRPRSERLELSRPSFYPEEEEGGGGGLGLSSKGKKKEKNQRASAGDGGVRRAPLTKQQGIKSNLRNPDKGRQVTRNRSDTKLFDRIWIEFAKLQNVDDHTPSSHHNNNNNRVEKLRRLGRLSGKMSSPAQANRKLHYVACKLGILLPLLQQAKIKVSLLSPFNPPFH